MGRPLEQAEFNRLSRLWLCALVAVLSMVFAACTPGATSTPPATEREPSASSSTPPPTRNPAAPTYYHGVFPGGRTGEEDDITLADLTSYEQTVGKQAAWVYFSDNWYHGRAFPTGTAAWIRDAGSLPWLRLMLRSSSDQDVAEPVYNLKAILAGRFDADLRTWCDGARDFGSPLLVEWGTEANGEWFSWNGSWNGGATSTGYGDRHRADGPERFVDVFRHLVTTCRERGADNVRWAWHVDAESWPRDEWNDLEAYWPGSDVVDVIAVSAYGAQQPTDTESSTLRSLLDRAYPRLTALAKAGGEPVVLAEFGVTDHNPRVDQAEWAKQALTDITGGRWPGLAGFSWWNEQWENDDNPAHDTTMRVQDNPKLAAVFTDLVGRNNQVLARLPDGVLR